MPTLAAVNLDTNVVLAPYMGVFFIAFTVSVLATPLMRWLAVRNGIIDWPDLNRKSHIEPVAYLGGVAIFMGWLAGVFLALFTAPHNLELAQLHITHVAFPISILFGATVITLTGLVDDVYGISPRVKVGGQFFAAAALAMQDVGTKLVAELCNATGIAAPYWLVYALGAVIIAVFVLGGCNSVNLLDGLDGLAAGVVAIAFLGFLFIAVQASSEQLAPDAMFTDSVRIVMCLAVVGALLGFLPYNFNPATIFMGDAGSLLLGYLSVATILLFAHTSQYGPLLVMAALIVFAVPIIDTSLAIFRRKMRGQPIFSPDNQHLHHQLIRTGLSVKRAVLLLYALGIFFAVLGGSLIFLRSRYVLAVFVVMFTFITVMAYKSGHRNALMQKLASAPPPVPTPPAPSE